MKKCFMLMSLLGLSLCLNAAALKLPSIIGDNMVLQRHKTVPLWGWTDPEAKVTVKFNGQIRSTVANKTGKWEVRLSPMEAGGPYELIVSDGKTTKTVKNILVGEVWLCSGQSNMWWPVTRSDNPEEEIKNADYPKIRLFFTRSTRSPKKPKTDVKGSWKVCSPETVGPFSAVAYYFGRELYQKMNIPIGLIRSCVGGTPAEAWTRREDLYAEPTLQPIAKSAEFSANNYAEAKAIFDKKMVGWYEIVMKESVKSGIYKQNWQAPGFNDSSWPLMQLPGVWENHALALDGIVIFRKNVTIPQEWANKELVLSLGKIDDCDITWFNGVKVGETGMKVDRHWAKQRNYIIPANLVKAGKATIAVEVFDHFSNGGFGGPPKNMFISLKDGKCKKVSLVGDWHYHVAMKIDYKKVPSRPVAPMIMSSNGFPSTLYNGMIAPLCPYAIQGVIWYQGESNAGNPERYQILFPAMIKGWRKQWGQGEFPFLFVQLASFVAHHPGKPLPSDMPKPKPGDKSKWAELREAQLMTLSLPKTGMAVTTDIGDPIDIHPTNKQDVGKRLALAARKIAYNQNLIYSGPIYKSMKIEGHKIRLFFDHIDGGLVFKGDKLNGFAIAGKDKKYVWANAQIDGRSVLVWSDEIKEPAYVRYAWQRNPENSNLFNRAGLPASPFRTSQDDN